MIVVVSAIVDPWVTTFSFVVALAMRIQGLKIGLQSKTQASMVMRDKKKPQPKLGLSIYWRRDPDSNRG